jgi:MFS family permease
MQIPRHILPIIVFSQFCCTSLWFASNAIINDLALTYGLDTSITGNITSAVQLGFISGTLVFAILSIADRFSPSVVFMVCAFLGAAVNLGVLWSGNTLLSLLIIRFVVGFFLAGIYPVGMKIAADYYSKGLGLSLSLLVGALVLGTAFPHLLKVSAQSIDWRIVIYITSALAALGGLLIYLFVPDGPNRKPAQQVVLSSFFQVFKNKLFRAAAFGYFGHMWELYTFWAFVPIMIATFNNGTGQEVLDVSLWAFLIIGIGAIACVIGGMLSQRYGTRIVAIAALTLSGLCCLIMPLIIGSGMVWLFVIFLLFWGMTVIADSPLFSTMVAQNATPELKGTALTIVNCIGFAITIVSIQLLSALWTGTSSPYVFMILAIGPALGLLALQQGRNSQS